jgi:hypothetical protein
MDEGQLFFLLLGALTAIGLVIGGMLVVWARSSFGGINLVHLLLALVHFLSLPILGSMGLLGLHILKRYERS